MMIPGFEKYISIEPLDKGWSGDKKYCVSTTDGTRHLLRISPAERHDSRKALFEMLEQVEALGIPMCQPLEFGICEGGVYTLHSWIDGEDLEAVLPLLPETEQYVLGLRSGEILRKIHSIPAPETPVAWESRFNRKIDSKIKMHNDCPIKFDGAECMITYINENRHLLTDRPQCFQHGDYHVGNMMLENGKLVIIDFDRFDFGDPWEEFNRRTWCAQSSPHFATGMVNGYFDGKPPMEFWRLLALYISSNMLSSVPWAVPFGQDEINTMLNQAKDVLAWYDNMQSPVPTWYLRDFYIQYIDGMPYKLKAPFDFSFLSKYGTVFKVFDDQDSGNICFGVADGEHKYFVKFAGAPTERAGVSAQEAIVNLRRTVPIYQDLTHPNLIKFINAEEIGGGFAMVFEWVDAEYMGRMYPLSRKKFMQMPLDAKLEVFREILEFQAFVADKGYVAIDFYDGSVMYDFNKSRTVICDIDFFAKAPYEPNVLGKLQNSPV